MPQRAMEDFGDEPSMSFGKALIVFIVLHVVAVSGIYIFNSLKARNIEQASPATRAVKQSASPAVADSGNATARQNAQDARPLAPGALPKTTGALPKPTAAAEAAKAAETPHRRIADEPAATKPPVKDTTVTVRDSGQLYTVVKGDNPVTIAHKLHVNYDELLKINKIEDPKKLKIGQKLRIPAKTKKQ